MEFSIRLVPLAKLFFCAALLSTCLLNAEDLQQSVDVDSAQLAGEFAAFIEQADLMRTETARELDQTRQEIVACEVENRDWNWRLLPDGLIWHSYMAAPHEPRISTLIFYDQNDGVYWDATLGGRVGLLRYGTKGPRHPSGWQWDLEGAVITRLDLLSAEDIESMDYRFGTEITAGEGPWAAKFGYFHVSSHVGDEYQIRHPLFQRVNYVTESLIFGVSYTAREILRLYGETAYAFGSSDGARQWQFQTGLEYTPWERQSSIVAPFAAFNVDVRQSVDFNPTFTLQAGWVLRGLESDRQLRFGLQCANGYSSQFEFFRDRERYVGLGVWFDY